MMIDIIYLCMATHHRVAPGAPAALRVAVVAEPEVRLEVLDPALGQRCAERLLGEPARARGGVAVSVELN
jgi:hypothetical protein